MQGTKTQDSKTWRGKFGKAEGRYLVPTWDQGARMPFALRACAVPSSPGWKVQSRNGGSLPSKAQTPQAQTTGHWSSSLFCSWGEQIQDVTPICPSA